MPPTSHTLGVRVKSQSNVVSNALRGSAPGVFHVCTALIIASILVSILLLLSSLMSPTPSIRNRPLMVAFISMARPFYCSCHPDVPDVCTVIALQVREALHAPFSKNWTSMDQYPFGSTLNFCAIVSFSCVHMFTHSSLSVGYQLFR